MFHHMFEVFGAIGCKYNLQSIGIQIVPDRRDNIKIEGKASRVL